MSTVKFDRLKVNQLSIGNNGNLIINASNLTNIINKEGIYKVFIPDATENNNSGKIMMGIQRDVNSNGLGILLDRDNIVIGKSKVDKDFIDFKSNIKGLKLSERELSINTDINAPNQCLRINRLVLNGVEFASDGTSIAEGYLPLTGGTLSGPLIVKSTSEFYPSTTINGGILHTQFIDNPYWATSHKYVQISNVEATGQLHVKSGAYMYDNLYIGSNLDKEYEYGYNTGGFGEDYNTAIYNNGYIYTSQEIRVGTPISSDDISEGVLNKNWFKVNGKTAQIYGYANTDTPVIYLNGNVDTNDNIFCNGDSNGVTTITSSGIRTQRAKVSVIELGEPNNECVTYGCSGILIKTPLNFIGVSSLETALENVGIAKINTIKNTSAGLKEEDYAIKIKGDLHIISEDITINDNEISTGNLIVDSDIYSYPTEVIMDEDNNATSNIYRITKDKIQFNGKSSYVGKTDNKYKNSVSNYGINGISFSGGTGASIELTYNYGLVITGILNHSPINTSGNYISGSSILNPDGLTLQGNERGQVLLNYDGLQINSPNGLTVLNGSQLKLEQGSNSFQYDSGKLTIYGPNSCVQADEIKTTKVSNPNSSTANPHSVIINYIEADSDYESVFGEDINGNTKGLVNITALAVGSLKGTSLYVSNISKLSYTEIDNELLVSNSIRVGQSTNNISIQPGYIYANKSSLWISSIYGDYSDDKFTGLKIIGNVDLDKSSLYAQNVYTNQLIAKEDNILVQGNLQLNASDINAVNARFVQIYENDVLLSNKYSARKSLQTLTNTTATISPDIVYMYNKSTPINKLNITLANISTEFFNEYIIKFTAGMNNMPITISDGEDIVVTNVTIENQVYTLKITIAGDYKEAILY